MLEVWKFTNKHLKEALKLAIDNHITHKELADWSFRYLNEVYIKDVENNPLDDKATKVMLEIDDHWEMYLSNSYNLSELQVGELETVKMPIEWLISWYNSI